LKKYNSTSISNKHIKNFDLFYDKQFILVKEKLKINIPNMTFKSLIEKEICKLIDNSIINDRNIIKPLELDIYSEKYQFGIEYNGLMFHSFGKSKYKMFDNFKNEKIEQFKHLFKTELCEEKKLQLFHIFENEWLDLNKQKIWKSIINSKIGNTKKIMARKCEIKEIDSKIANNFINENHIQGIRQSSKKIGLFFENELLSVMTFGKPMQNKYKGNNNYELIRFCSKKNYTIVGGASKLLTFFERKYKPNLIISYANRRWSKGNLYFKLGFKHIGNTSMNYFYLKENKLILLNRMKFQKHKIKDYYEKKIYDIKMFNEKLSEKENMYNNGYRKIYDVGNMIFIKKLKKYAIIIIKKMKG